MSTTAIVTGGAKGIGRACVNAFARSGYNVVINYNTSHEEAKALAFELTQKGHSVVAVKADVTNRAEVDEMVDFAIRRFGKVDVLTNNAGISQIKLFCDITQGDWDEMITTNLKGMFNCSQAVIGNMISNKSGKIINISSMWGEVGASCEVHYSAAKAGVIGFTKALAKEMGPSNITVNCITPGFIETEMNQDISIDDKDALIDATPLLRLGSVCDVAQAVLFFASKDANFITGQVLGVNGGLVI